MGTGRKFNKAPITRPKKKLADRKRRQKIHKSRLVALGLKEDDLNKMTPGELRELLKRPGKIKAAS